MGVAMYGEDDEYTYTPPVNKTTEDDEYTYVAPKPKGILDKLKAAGEARNKAVTENPVQTLLSDIGNIPIGGVSVGFLAQKARNIFGGTPSTTEGRLGNPTLGGVAHGLSRIPIGTGQMAAAAGEELGIPGSEESAMRMREAAKGNEAYWKDNYDPSQTGVAAGEALPYLLTGGGAAATKAKQLPRFLEQAKLAAQRATAGGAINAIQPDTESITDEEYARRAWARAKGGATMGALIPPAANLAVKGGGYALDKMAGTRLGNMEIPFTDRGYSKDSLLPKFQAPLVKRKLIPTEVKPGFEGAPEEMAALQARGLKPTVGDVTGDKVIMGQEARQTSKSPKLIQHRAEGSVASLKDAQKVVEDQYGKMRASNWEGLSDLEAASKNKLHPRYEEAQRVIKMMKESGIDAGDTEVASAMGRLFKQQSIGDKLYAKADAIARPHGEVPAPGLADHLKASVDELESIGGTDKKVIGLLKEVHEMVLNADRVKNPPVRTPARTTPAETDLYGTVTKPASTTPASVVGEEATGPAQDMTYPGLRQLKNRLNRVVSEGIEGTPSPSGVELTHLNEAISEIDRHMAAFAKPIPGLKEAAAAASDHTVANIVPYKEAKFGRALVSPDASKSEAIFLQGKNAAEKERYFALLGKKGQEAAKARLIETAIKSGKVPAQGAYPESLTTRKAFNSLEALEDNGTLDVMFKGPERKAVEGLRRALQTVRQQEGINYSPEQSIPEGMYPTKAGMLHGTLARLNRVLTEKKLYDLYTNPNSKLFFQRLSKQKAGSPGFIEALNNFAKTANDKGQLP